MGLVFIPSTAMPPSPEALREAYWFAVWDRPIPVPHDLLPGGTVYLADLLSGTIVWETVVIDMVSVPYESSLMLRDHLSRRWHVEASEIRGDDPCPGYCIAWRAAPVARLDLALPEGLDPLHMWTSTYHLTEEERELRGLRDEGPCPVC